MDLGTFYRICEPAQLSSLSLDIGPSPWPRTWHGSPLPTALTLWPPVLLPWPFLLRMPGEFFQLRPHTRTSHLAATGSRMVKPSTFLRSHSRFALRPRSRSLNLLVLISPFSLHFLIPAVLTLSCCLPDVLYLLMPLSQAASAAFAISCPACHRQVPGTQVEAAGGPVVVVLPFLTHPPCSRVPPAVLTPPL